MTMPVFTSVLKFSKVTAFLNDISNSILLYVYCNFLFNLFLKFIYKNQACVQICAQISPWWVSQSYITITECSYTFYILSSCSFFTCIYTYIYENNFETNIFYPYPPPPPPPPLTDWGRVTHTSWISPRIRLISSELDIISHVPGSQLSRHRGDVISNRLWRQSVNRVSETLGRCVKIVDFIVIYWFVISCKK